MTTPDAKTRLIAAMVDAMQRQGYHGSGLTELLAGAALVARVPVRGA